MRKDPLPLYPSLSYFTRPPSPLCSDVLCEWPLSKPEAKLTADCHFEKDSVDITNCNFNRKAIKEQGYVQDDINGIKTIILIDSGAEISLLSNVLFNQIKEKPVFIQNDIDLFTANGTSMSVLGKTTIELRLNDRAFEHVVVVEDCSYNFLLGQDFWLQNKACIDFVSCSLKLLDIEISFVAPKERNIVSTVSDLSIDAITTVAIQTQLTSRTSLTSELLIGGGFSKDNSYFVVRIITKAQSKKKKISVRISNLMERSLFLQINTEIADAILFVEEKNTNLERKNPLSLKVVGSKQRT